MATRPDIKVGDHIAVTSQVTDRAYGPVSMMREEFEVIEVGGDFNESTHVRLRDLDGRPIAGRPIYWAEVASGEVEILPHR